MAHQARDAILSAFLKRACQRLLRFLLPASLAGIEGSAGHTAREVFATAALYAENAAHREAAGGHGGEGDDKVPAFLERNLPK